MMKSVLLIFVLLALLCVHGSTNTKNTLGKFLNSESSSVEMKKTDDMTQLDNAAQNKKVVKMDAACCYSIIRCVNWILPGFLPLNQAFLMSGLHFSLRGVDHYFIGCPVLIANSILVHQQLMLGNDPHSSAVGEVGNLYGENAIANTWKITPTQTVLVIAAPIFFDFLRWSRYNSPIKSKIYESRIMEFFVKFVSIAMITFVEPIYFNVLLPLSFLAYDEEMNYFLFFSVTTALCMFPTFSINAEQIGFVLFSILVQIVSRILFVRLEESDKFNAMVEKMKNYLAKE